MEYLIVFWATVAEQIPNGALNGWTKNDVENACEWGGEENELCDALIECGFLEENLCSIHDFKPIACNLFPYNRNQLDPDADRLFIESCMGLKRLK